MADEQVNQSGGGVSGGEIGDMLNALAGGDGEHALLPYQYDDDVFYDLLVEGHVPLHYMRTHRAHVRMAYVYLLRRGLDGAREGIGEALKKFFAREDVPETLATGFHATMTEAWIRIVDFVMRVHGRNVNSNAFCDVHAFLGSNTLLRLFYSEGLLYSEAAKQGVVEPDLGVGLPG